MTNKETDAVIKKVNQALQSIRIVGKINCKTQEFPYEYKYDYTADQAKAIIDGLKQEVKKAEDELTLRFKITEQEKFKF